MHTLIQLDEAETAKRELQDEVSELRCLKEQIAAELATTTKEAAESKVCPNNSLELLFIDFDEYAKRFLSIIIHRC